jgi:hypothetical protein
MNATDPLTALLDELVPNVEPEDPAAWEDVLARVEERKGLSIRTGHRRGRWLASALAALTALVIAATALAVAGVNPITAIINSWDSSSRPASLNGTYTTTLTGLKPASRDGTWKLTLALYRVSRNPNAQTFASGKYGRYTLTHDGATIESGTFIFGGNQHSNLTLTDSGGSQPCADAPVGGFYNFKYNQHGLILEAQFDRCTARRLILNKHLFTT